MSEFDLTELGKAQDEEKKWKAKREKLKTRFFEWVTEQVAEEPLAETYACVYAVDEEHARKRIAKYNPTFRVDALRPIAGTETELLGVQWEVILIEDPAFKPYSVVGPDGREYGRQIRAGSINLDDEAVKFERPDLWESITEEVTERRLKPLDDLPAETLAALQDFMYEGKPTVALPAPKKPKEEDG